MASFVVLGNYTEQGVSGIKDLPQRLEAVKEAAQAAGGRLIFYYMTLGAYDFVVVLELPDSETAAQQLLQTSLLGNVRTQTMRAFTEEEAANIVGALQ